MTRPILFLLFFLLSLTSLQAQNPAPCATPAHRQFDFWVGEWEVYSTSADTLVGHNTIRNILNGCVIEENWTGATGFAGKSFNTYNPLDSTWNQVWVDVSGATYHFSGRYADQVMSMKGETVTRRGKMKFDMSYTYDEENNTVHQLWRMSADDGKSWNILFDGIYRKKE